MSGDSITRVVVKGFANTYLIKGDKGTILVDAGLPGGEKSILEKCSELNTILKLIFITHGHMDHMGSAAALKNQAGAKVAVHVNDSEALHSGISKVDQPIGLVARLMRPFIGKIRTNPVEPEILISDEIRLDEYGINGRVLLTPGHTSGSISVVLDSGEAFVSDLIMGGFFGQICPRHPNLPPYETSRIDIKNSVKYVLEQKLTIIYPGHGGPFLPETVARWYQHL